MNDKVALIISLFGTFLSTFGSYKLISWRIEQLEKKVEKGIDNLNDQQKEIAVHDTKINTLFHIVNNTERE